MRLKIKKANTTNLSDLIFDFTISLLTLSLRPWCQLLMPPLHWTSWVKWPTSNSSFFPAFSQPIFHFFPKPTLNIPTSNGCYNILYRAKALQHYKTILRHFTMFSTFCEKHWGWRLPWHRYALTWGLFCHFSSILSKRSLKSLLVALD